CIGFSLMALQHPHDSERFMGNVARRRARPWLVAASFPLLAACVAVTALVTWSLRGMETRDLMLPAGSSTLSVVDIVDLGVTGLRTRAGGFLGRAVPSYELFTCNVLPRGALAGQWRNSLVFAATLGPPAA